MDQLKMKELEQIISSKYGNTTGIVIIKDGVVSYEKYFKGCTANSRVHIYSVTKSVISILIGIALEYADHAAPYKYRFFTPYIKYFTSSDWVKFSLDLLGGHGKIGIFRYAPLIGPDILSGILVKATGQSVLDFAAENLFEPLGIKVEGNLLFESKEEQLAFNQSTNNERVGNSFFVPKTGDRIELIKKFIEPAL